MKDRALIILTIFLSILLILNIANALESTQEARASLLVEEPTALL